MVQLIHQLGTFLLMTRNRAKKIALKIVRGWGHFLPSFGSTNVLAYAPYIPLYFTPDIVSADHARDRASDRMVRLMRDIDRRIRDVVGYDPVLQRMQHELQVLRVRLERQRSPDILCSRAQAEQIEQAMRRYAEADVRLMRFYGTITIQT